MVTKIPASFCSVPPHNVGNSNKLKEFFEKDKHYFVNAAFENQNLFRDDKCREFIRVVRGALNMEITKRNILIGFRI
jgi:hypothetical protein